MPFLSSAIHHVEEEIKEPWGEQQCQCHQDDYVSFFLNPDRSLGLLESAVMGRGRTGVRWVWWCQLWMVGLNFTPSAMCLFLFLSEIDLCAHDFYPIAGSVLTWSLSYFPLLWSSVPICSSNRMMLGSLCKVITFEKKSAKFVWVSVNICSAVYSLTEVETIIVDEVGKRIVKLEVLLF